MFDKSKKSFKNYYGKISDGLLIDQNSSNKRTFIDKMKYTGNVFFKIREKNKDFNHPIRVSYHKNIRMNEENIDDSLKFIKFLSSKRKKYI